MIKDLLQLLEDNNNKFEYGQIEEFDRVIEECEDFKYNGISPNKRGYYWYSIIIDGEEYQVYCRICMK